MGRQLLDVVEVLLDTEQELDVYGSITVRDGTHTWDLFHLQRENALAVKAHGKLTLTKHVVEWSNDCWILFDLKGIPKDLSLQEPPRKRKAPDSPSADIQISLCEYIPSKWDIYTTVELDKAIIFSYVLFKEAVQAKLDVKLVPLDSTTQTPKDIAGVIKAGYELHPTIPNYERILFESQSTPVLPGNLIPLSSPTVAVPACSDESCLSVSIDLYEPADKKEISNFISSIPPPVYTHVISDMGMDGAQWIATWNWNAA